MSFHDFQLSGEQAAAVYESHNVQIMRPFVAALLQKAQLQSDQALLDVACGTGIVARTAVSNVPRLEVVGVDLNLGMLQVARANDPLVTWEQAPADHLPFAGGTFDVVACQQGLQFFPDPGAAVMEMERVVALDGRVVATVWAPLEKNPFFQAQKQAIEDLLSDGASAGLQTAIRDDGDEFLKGAFIEGGLEEIEITLVEAAVELPTVAQWAQEHIMGTPRGPLYAALSEGDKEAFGEHFVDVLAQFINDDDTATVPFASWLAVGRKL